LDLNTGVGQAVTALPSNEVESFASAYMRIFGERAIVLTGSVDGSFANITCVKLDGDSWKVDDEFPQTWYTPFVYDSLADQDPDLNIAFAKDGRPLALVGLNDANDGDGLGNAKAFMFSTGRDGSDTWGVAHVFPETPCANYQRSAISTTSGPMVVTTCRPKSGRTEGWPVWAYRLDALTDSWVPMTVQNEAGPSPSDDFNNGGLSIFGNDMAIADGHGQVRMYQMSQTAWVYNHTLTLPSGKA